MLVPMMTAPILMIRSTTIRKMATARVVLAVFMPASLSGLMRRHFHAFGGHRGARRRGACSARRGCRGGPERPTPAGSAEVDELQVDVEVIELRDLAHAITDNLLTGFPSGALADAVASVAAADAVIAVTPVFSASYSGLFKSFFDILDDRALAGTPAARTARRTSRRHRQCAWTGTCSQPDSG